MILVHDLKRFTKGDERKRLEKQVKSISLDRLLKEPRVTAFAVDRDAILNEGCNSFYKEERKLMKRMRGLVKVSRL